MGIPCLITCGIQGIQNVYISTWIKICAIRAITSENHSEINVSNFTKTQRTLCDRCDLVFYQLWLKIGSLSALKIKMWIFPMCCLGDVENEFSFAFYGWFYGNRYTLTHTRKKKRSDDNNCVVLFDLHFDLEYIYHLFGGRGLLSCCFCFLLL